METELLMSTFVKLDQGILNSTIWLDRDARDVFLTALLLAVPREFDKPVPQLRHDALEPTGWSAPPGWYGFVPSSGLGLIDRAKVAKAEGMAALDRLGSPEPESRSQAFDGRRMIRVDGGFIVLNYDKYRQKDQSAASRAKRYRDTHKQPDGEEPPAPPEILAPPAPKQPESSDDVHEEQIVTPASRTVTRDERDVTHANGDRTRDVTHVDVDVDGDVDADGLEREEETRVRAISPTQSRPGSTSKPKPRDPMGDQLRGSLPGQNPDVARLFDVWRATFPQYRNARLGHADGIVATAISRALQVYSFEECERVIRESPRDKQVAGQGEDKMPHDTLTYILGNENAFARILAAAESGTRSSSRVKTVDAAELGLP